MIFEKTAYLKKYDTIRSSSWNRNYVPRKTLWRGNDQTFKELHRIIRDQVDFIWFAFNFTLISKSIFVFSPQNYVFCESYIDSLHGYDYLRNIFRKVYSGKGKCLVDMENVRVPTELADLFRAYSLSTLNTYTSDFIYGIKALDHHACLDRLEYKVFLRKIIESKYFTEEFSDSPDKLSFKYLDMLVTKVRGI